jgi:nucleolar complex protein 3
MVKKERTKNGRPTKKAKLPAKPMIPKARTIANFDTPITELNTRERCELIAELSESILEDPQGAFATIAPQNSNEDMVKENWSVGNQSKMRRLLDLTNPLKNQNDDTTSRLSMLSLLAIFQDILPSYRIRLPTADELSVRVTKETKKIWDYERALLSSYQQYLKLLEYQWDSGNEQKQKGKTQTLGVVCVTSILCFCELLKSASHFNFRSNILSTVVKQMNHRSCDEVSSSCCAAVTHLFETDKQGDVALEAAKLACKMIKDAYAKGSRGSMNVRPAVVKSFLSLPLRVHADEAQAAKLAEQANAKKRKRDQEANDLEQDMREGESAVDKITLARSQADTLHTVVLTYFRILKGIDPPSTTSKEAKTVYNSNLLAPSLEGLGKFGHLINFDTVSDLLVVLKGLLKDVDSLPLGASLNCVLTAFQTLQNAGRELQIDQKEYVAPLFSQLPR